VTPPRRPGEPTPGIQQPGRKLTDTGDRLQAIAEEAGAAGAKAVLAAQGEEPTAPHRGAWWSCENDPTGPAFKLNRRMEAMEMRVGAMEKDHERAVGRRTQSAWIVTIVGLLLGLTTAAAAWAAVYHRDEKTAATNVDLARELLNLKSTLDALSRPQGQGHHHLGIPQQPSDE
jgi:hypothetical protein